MVTSASLDSLSLTFGALSDPTRRAILAKLRRGRTSVTEVAGAFPMSLPAITKHLKVLERAGLIVRSRDSRWRPSQLDAGPLKEAFEWMSEYRDFWEGQMDRLDEYMQELMKKEIDDV